MQREDILVSILHTLQFPFKRCFHKSKKRGKIRLSDKEEKELLTIFKKKELDYLLIFAVEKADRRKKIVKEIEKEGALVEFPTLKGISLSRWIKNELLLQEKQVEEDALIELVERAGDDLRLLKGELEKIITYMGKENTTPVACQFFLLRKRGASLTWLRLWEKECSRNHSFTLPKCADKMSTVEDTGR